jgi:hypothetical protein
VLLEDQQLGRADVRLAYVQHPFPAQGQTTDTAHLIVGEHATSEGTYVALTRARQQAHIYGAFAGAGESDADCLAELAERISRSEPDLPSISVPLAHEALIREHMMTSPQPSGPSDATAATEQHDSIAALASGSETATSEARSVQFQAPGVSDHALAPPVTADPLSQRIDPAYRARWERERDARGAGLLENRPGREPDVLW